MTPQVLLLIGVVTTTTFFAVILVEGALRPGYNPAYHTGSELELGPRGWIQRTNFLLTGGGMAAYAVGVQQTLDSVIATTLLGVMAVSFIVSGVFAPDPVRGYPPSAPSAHPLGGPSLHARIHDATGPLMFVAFVAACLLLASRLEGGWRLYTLLTAGLGLVMTVWTATAYNRDASNTGLVQRGLLFVFSSWTVALGIHLAAHPSSS